MELITPLTLEQFLTKMHKLDTDEDNVGSFSHTVGTDTFTILYQDDRQPTYYTTFDDNTVIFDSYDADIDDTLQKSKTLCYGKTVIPFTMTDTFTPDMDESQFALLLNEAKSLAWAELKQTQHAIAERNSRRGWTSVLTKKHALKTFKDLDKLPNFGRK